jgi:hypothetical protein
MAVPTIGGCVQHPGIDDDHRPDLLAEALRQRVLDV